MKNEEYLKRNRGGTFCKKSLPGPLPKNSYNLRSLPPHGQGLRLNPWVAIPHHFDPTTGLPSDVSACNNKEFLKGVAGGNFLQKVASGMPSIALNFLQPLWRQRR